MKKKIQIDKRYFEVILYIVFLLLQIIVISNKVDYHIDETLSYGLANYTKGYFVALEEGHKYEPAADPFIEYLSVSPGNRSNLAIAWTNQANDSHPPFYYALVHIMGAFNVGRFTKWSGGIINIVFSLMTLFVIRKIIELLTDSEDVKNAVSVGFILTYGILSDSALFRMYFMSMFLVTLTTYIILLQIKKDMKQWFYLLMIVIVSTGTLTHYYCLLYDILISVVYCVYLLFKKKWKDVLLYCVSMGIAAAITIAIFPSIIRHLFHTEHAYDAFSGITEIYNYISRIWICFSNLNDMLFGKLLFIFIPLILFFWFSRNRKADKESFKLYKFICLPTVLYFILIAVTASYTNERYFTPIFALLYTGVFCLLFEGLRQRIADQKKFKRMIALVCLISVCLSYVGAKWPYLYRSDLEYLNKAETHKNSDCICIHGEYRLGWEVQLNFNEFIKYKSFTLLNRDKIQIEDLSQYFDGKDLVVSLICIDNKEDYIKQIIDVFPQFSDYEIIGGNGNGVSFYLH